MSSSALPSNAKASFSNVLLNLSSDTTPVQYRLYYEALAKFNTNNQEVIQQIRDDAYAEMDRQREEHIKSGQSLDTLELDEATILTNSVKNYYFRFTDKRTLKISFKNHVNYWSNVKNSDGQYGVIKKGLDNLLSITHIAEFKNPDGTRTLKRINVFSQDTKTIGLNGTDSIELILNADFVPFLVMLTEIYKGAGYTSIPVALLRNKRYESSFAILNLLLRYYKKAGKKSQAFKFDLETFRKHTDTQNKYKTFKDLRVWYIEPAVKEISNDPNMNLEVSFSKTGRKYTHVSFVFTITNRDQDFAHMDDDLNLGNLVDMEVPNDENGYIEGEFEKL
ncbi:TPA: replication initiation protein [Vibrio parahaemolyticus]|nr:RepB family plasmid replication initiator protein [Vibrio cholerae]HCE4999432.1 replication initiation protein [Vibrio parahaemolyticus]